MQLRNSLSRYGMVAVALHWLTVTFVVAAWLLGTFHDDLTRGTIRSTGLFIHMSAGLAVELFWPCVFRGAFSTGSCRLK